MDDRTIEIIAKIGFLLLIGYSIPKIYRWISVVLSSEKAENIYGKLLNAFFIVVGCLVTLTVCNSMLGRVSDSQCVDARGMYYC